MYCFKDITFCVSPTCENRCGRKYTEVLREQNKDNMPISASYFCDSDGQPFSREDDQ